MVGTALARTVAGTGGVGASDWWWIWAIAGVVVVALLVVLVIEVWRRDSRGFDTPPERPGPGRDAATREGPGADPRGSARTR